MARKLDRLTRKELQEIRDFIADLDLIPAQFVTESVIRSWRVEVMIEQQERAIDLIHKDEIQELLEKFYRRNTRREKRFSSCPSDVQLKINFD